MSELKVVSQSDVMWNPWYRKYYYKTEADRVITHHKYKRCLAMAKWCRTSARCEEGLGAFKYRDWYWKWFKRWLALAEKFKEG